MKRRSRKRAASAGRVVLLGPQSPNATLGTAIRDLDDETGSDGRIALITAGWRDREGDPTDLEPEVARRLVDLELYRRTASIGAADPDFARAHTAAQDRLKLLRRAYNTRLDALIAAERKLSAILGDEDVLDTERADALDAIRRLDARHLERVTELRGDFEASMRPSTREAVSEQRAEVDALLRDASMVVLAGGHIATLLNRLRLFGGSELFAGRPVIGWSAGAMALAERVVLFHDRPPWGAGNAEAFDRGLGLVQGVVPLPNARARLDLDDRRRTARLAARFAPDACVLLDPGVRVDWAGGEWAARGRVRRLDRAGRQIRFRAAAA